MNYRDIPERDLNPPEDRRETVYRCMICDDPIREGDDYYEVPGFGPCCEGCIEESKKYDAELDDSGRYGEEDQIWLDAIVAPMEKLGVAWASSWEASRSGLSGEFSSRISTEANY